MLTSTGCAWRGWHLGEQCIPDIGGQPFILLSSGFGNYLARPLFRERHSPDMSEAEATKLMHDALRVCFYRDKQSINKFKLATVTAAGVKISEPFMLETNWNYKVRQYLFSLQCIRLSSSLSCTLEGVSSTQSLRLFRSILEGSHARDKICPLLGPIAFL